MLYGFFSQKSKNAGHSTSVYSTPDGLEVEVSAVYKDPEGKSFFWDDKICVGPVKAFLREQETPFYQTP